MLQNFPLGLQVLTVTPGPGVMDFRAQVVEFPADQGSQNVPLAIIDFQYHGAPPQRILAPGMPVGVDFNLQRLNVIKI